jgi:hypothetical protein
MPHANPMPTPCGPMPTPCPCQQPHAACGMRPHIPTPCDMRPHSSGFSAGTPDPSNQQPAPPRTPPWLPYVLYETYQMPARQHQAPAPLVPPGMAAWPGCRYRVLPGLLLCHYHVPHAAGHSLRGQAAPLVTHTHPPPPHPPGARARVRALRLRRCWALNTPDSSGNLPVGCL